jgi:hypothetical protein
LATLAGRRFIGLLPRHLALRRDAAAILENHLEDYCSMPLTRGRVVGHDGERLAFKFTMQNGDETVECQISDAAMDELAGVKGTESLARQAQFMALRDAVERIASDMFDAAPAVKGYVVRIFTKHIPK